MHTKNTSCTKQQIGLLLLDLQASHSGKETSGRTGSEHLFFEIGYQ